MSFLAADTNTMCLGVIYTPHDVTVYNVGITVNNKEHDNTKSLYVM